MSSTRIRDTRLILRLTHVPGLVTVPPGSFSSATRTSFERAYARSSSRRVVAACSDRAFGDIHTRCRISLFARPCTRQPEHLHFPVVQRWPVHCFLEAYAGRDACWVFFRIFRNLRDNSREFVGRTFLVERGEPNARRKRFAIAAMPVALNDARNCGASSHRRA